MNRLWEENKAFVVVVGACLLLLIAVRPTIISAGPPLARWMGMGWKRDYDKLEAKNQTLNGQLKEYDPESGGQEISLIQERIGVSNRRLAENSDQYVHSLAFVPYHPFRLLENEKKPGHYFRTVLTNTRQALLLHCSLRSVQITEDLGFAQFDRGAVPPAKDVGNLLRQLAVADTFIRLCADCQIESTNIENHLPKRATGTKGRPSFLWEYPMRVRLRTTFGKFMKLIQRLNGQYGLVENVAENRMREMVEKVTLTIGREDGVRIDDQFTIFKRKPGAPCGLVYAGRVTVTGFLDKGSVARVDEDSLPYDRFDTARKKALAIERGDYATTGFFRVSRMEIKALAGSILAFDNEKIPTKIEPHRLDISLEVSTIGFDPKTEHITVKNITKVTGGRVKRTVNKKKGPTAPTGPVHARPSW